ncbi:hypothetical protein L3X07_07440 [Levilactobacillus brevis]|nr:hypothetical protein [Levilactobacillus brevis]
MALADVQQSTYQVELTPSKDTSGALAGGDGDFAVGDNGNHSGSSTAKSPSGSRVSPTMLRVKTVIRYLGHRRGPV